MRPIPAPRLGDTHGLLRAINQRDRVRLDEFITEFSIEELFPPGLENALGRTRQFVSFARSAGLLKEERGTVELTEVGKRYVRSGDESAVFDVSPGQAEWLRRQLFERHMTDSIYHGVAIGLSLYASKPPDFHVSKLDFGRALGHLGRAGWDNENTLESQGERYTVFLKDLELIDDEGQLTEIGGQTKAELTLPVHMSLRDLAGQLNPGGLEAAEAEGDAEWAAASAQPEPEPEPEPEPQAAPAAEEPAAEEDIPAVIDTGEYEDVAGAAARAAERPSGRPVPPSDIWETAAPDEATRAYSAISPEEAAAAAARQPGPPPGAEAEEAAEVSAADEAAAGEPAAGPAAGEPGAEETAAGEPAARAPAAEEPGAAQPASAAEAAPASVPPPGMEQPAAAEEEPVGMTSGDPLAAGGMTSGDPLAAPAAAPQEPTGLEGPGAAPAAAPQEPTGLEGPGAAPAAAAQEPTGVEGPGVESAAPEVAADAPPADAPAAGAPVPVVEVPAELADEEEPTVEEPAAAAPQPPAAQGAAAVAGVDVAGEPAADVGAAPPPADAAAADAAAAAALADSVPPPDAEAQEAPAETAAPTGARAPSGFLDLAGVRSAAEGAGLKLPDSVYAGIIAALASGKHLVISGPAGSGKTTLALAVAKAAVQAGRSEGAALATASPKWSSHDTVGRAGDEGFTPGHVLAAAGKKKWLVIDEIDRAKLDKAFGDLSSFLGGLPLTLPDGSREVAAPGDWRIVATRDSTHGAPHGSSALLRRFAEVHLHRPDAAELEPAIDEAAGGDRTAAAAVKRLLAEAAPSELGAGVFLDAARHAAERNALSPATEEELERECREAYITPHARTADFSAG